MSENNNKGKVYNVKPLGARVIIRVENKDHTTESGIIIPASGTFVGKGGVISEGKMPRAEIIAMGPECTNEHIKVGDIVTFDPMVLREIWHPDNDRDQVQHFVTHETVFETVIR